ncbi:purine-nucleoside phosphorylase [Campylobacter sp. MIT 21-1685]|uniref:phosphorylase family protein n=1 Tax=unclassified Campylobacter TaxID=2593542 RepID=UPI00224B64CF|nr:MULTISPECIES: purine-nucleoside phosphorylase [unclassified Campylobacter]MCX2683514.1 purine-nucleoside phosphorylase [Campylobacter sp. MIT 21-1684]MCX2751827.1 purine-nucleoside phosphorylase [Campylobacter sp. MIT 21-1682]MCX2807996.1 purine-nucleoside phosphorylase [Campylobacter sp. MIT 21-1685]
MIVCAGGNEDFIFAKSIGIGLVESALNLTRLCLELKPTKIVFVGSCGIYDSGNILEIYKSSHAFNLEFSSLSNAFYTPAVNEICLDYNADTIHSNVDVKKKNVSCETYKINSSNYICQNPQAAKEFAKIGLHFENMEAFSVLFVAKKFNIQAECIVCATNFCNENAHIDFLANHSQAKKKLETYLQIHNYI